MNITSTNENLLNDIFANNLPSVEIDHIVGNYQLKTADSFDELRATFKLRYNVFYREFAGSNTEEPINQLDIENHDYMCDHLIVKDLRTNEVIACYRLLSCQNKPEDRLFYSESEFVIDEFLKNTRKKLELGRACVHKSYRRGTVILLLWRGIIEYATKCEADYLFGCSSITFDQFSFINQIMNEIAVQDKFINDWNISVQSKYKFDFHELYFENSTQNESKSSLMQVYLKSGAKVARQMAYDRSFNCIDLFTVIDLKDLSQSFKRGFRD